MPPGYLIYSVAKAALERFTSALAPELAPLGIAINALRPGRGEDRDDRDRVRRPTRLERLDDARRRSSRRSRRSAAQLGTDFTGRILDVARLRQDLGVTHRARGRVRVDRRVPIVALRLYDTARREVVPFEPPHDRAHVRVRDHALRLDAPRPRGARTSPTTS